jgi:hypothetical protein
MQSWQDMAVFYADNMGSEQTIHQQKFITYADLGKLEPRHPAFHFVPTITDLAIPQFMLLEKRHLVAIGVSLRKIC